MKTKLVKSITSYLLFACALVCLVAVIALGTSATAAAAADGQVCSVHTLRGLYLSSFDGYANIGGNLVPKAVMQGLQFNGDGTTFNTFGTVNIGGTIIIDATGPVGTYTVAADCTGTLSVPNGPTFNLYVGPGAQKFWTTQTAGRIRYGNGDTRAVAKTPPAVVARLDLLIIRVRSPHASVSRAARAVAIGVRCRAISSSIFARSVLRSSLSRFEAASMALKIDGSGRASLGSLVASSQPPSA